VLWLIIGIGILLLALGALGALAKRLQDRKNRVQPVRVLGNDTYAHLKR
jgi:hypothetical protein